MANLLTSAPAVGVIDESNNLIFSWTPIGSGGLFSDYAYWNLTIDATVFKVLPQWSDSPTNTKLGTQTFNQTLRSGAHTITMQAFDSSDVALTLPWQTSGVSFSRSFPDPLTQSSVKFNLDSVMLGQTLNVTLDPTYMGADQWQVMWPDGSTTGWYPLTANVVAKSFSISGAQDIIIQTRRDYSGSQYNPPVTLIRQIEKQVFVVDQQAPGTTTAGGGLTGDLGLGGQQGFEITEAGEIDTTENPWAVICRALVRDEITNELKLLIATSRYSNASSLLGTMAVDVFPIQGRPHSIELIEPVAELEVLDNTGSSPVKILTSKLPDLIVGKSVAQAVGGTLAMIVKEGTGIAPYLWSAIGLPKGVSMSSSGVINGTPLEFGSFTVTFAVQDSSNPFSIDEKTLSLLVTTDLAVQIAANQKDALNVTLIKKGTTLGTAQVGKPFKVQMQVGNINDSATTPGGLAPYQWTTPAGALPVGLSIDKDTGLISGVPCTYNSTSDFTKNYTFIVQVTDAIGAKATQAYTMSLIAAPLQFGQADQGTIYSAQDFKLSVPIFGGQSPYTFDTFQAPPSESTYYTSVPSTIIDGQVEVVANVPTTGTGTRNFSLLAHDANGTYTNSGQPTQVVYQVANEVSDVRLMKAFVDHVWGYNDSAAATPLAITGDLSGYTLNTAAAIPTNGISVTVDPATSQVVVAGPATVYSNAEVRIPLQLMQSSEKVGTISREYTFLAHNDQATPGDIGNIIVNAHPYIVNVDTVTLNPRKPYFNSSNLAAFNAGENSNWTARVKNGSSLPPGLSLDANTGLIYGKLVGMATAPSVIEYIDGGGTIHGTATINWTTYNSDFQPIPSFFNVDGHQMGTPFDATAAILTAPPGMTLSSVQVVYPQYASRLPEGVSLAIDPSQTKVLMTGTPTEAGYFDLWLRVVSGSQTAYVYHRLAINYTKPMVIVTSSLPTISNQPYTVTLQGFGGIPPYTWSSDLFPSGQGTGNFAGLTLTSNPDNTATVSGTLTSTPGSSPTDLGNIKFILTDTRGSSSAVSKQLDLVYDNRLRITTPAIPIIVPSTDYGFGMQAAGGVPPYTWQIANSPSLPQGITFDAVQPLWGSTGAFSGTYSSLTPYDQMINITVKDSEGSTSSGYNVSGAPFEIKTGEAALSIAYNSNSAVNRGVPYQGALQVINGAATVTAPVSWQVAPTATHPNTLLPGLTLQADAASQGVTATIAGTYSGIPHQIGLIKQIVGNGTTATVTLAQSHGFTIGNTVVIAGTQHFDGSYPIQSVASPSFTIDASYNGTENLTGNVTATVDSNLYTIRVVATDAAGQAAVALIQLGTGTDLQVTTAALPNATVGGSYPNVQLAATGGVAPYVWSIDPMSADTLSGTGLSLSSAGVVSGTATGIFNKTIMFRVTDAVSGVANIARAIFSLQSQASGLAITTTAITDVTSGRDYSFTLQASGSPNLPYKWSIVSGALPAPLALNPDTGVISGNTKLTGFNQPVTFRVTDSIGAHIDKALNVKVVAGLALVSGIDFTDSINTGVIGYICKGAVDSINPRPNRSFYVVATGAISTSPSQIAVSVGNSNVSAVVESVSGGNAFIKLSGSAFAAGQMGNNVLSISVTDSGVNATGSFTWVVYDDGTLRLGATLPTQLTTP